MNEVKQAKGRARAEALKREAEEIESVQTVFDRLPGCQSAIIAGKFWTRMRLEVAKAANMAARAEGIGSGGKR